MIKKLLEFSIALLLLSSYPVYSQSNWFWQQPLPTGNQFYCVKMVNQQIVYAAGVLGTIVKTTNGGMNWTVLNTNTQTTLKCIDFIDAGTGVAGGDSGIVVRTTNGGSSWTKQVISGATLRGVDFADQSTTIGYIASLDGFIYKTTNGGLNWTQRNTGTINPLLAVKFLDSLNGFASGVAMILKTKDGGLNWTSNTLGLSGFDFLNAIAYNDLQNVLVLREENRIFKTTNGGVNWVEYLLPFPDIGFSGDFARYTSFANINTGFVVSNFGRIAKTINGGINWIVDSTFTRYDSQIGLLWGLNTFDTNNATAVGSGGKITRTTDGGMSWSIQNGFKKALNGNFFTTAGTGYSVGDSGKIFKTTNSGDEWNLLNSGATKKLNSIFFVNENTGYVCGDTALILKTTNAGSNWILQSAGLNGMHVNINDVFFQDGNTGMAAVDSGKILITTNGGANWMINILGFERSLESVYILNSSNALSCSTNGIYRTNNGGLNWITIATGTKGRGFDFAFADSLNGICIGATNEIHITSNGGNNWIRISLPGTPTALYSVCFGNDSISFAAGDQGTILKSTNRGLSWIKFPQITQNVLSSIFFMNANTGYIAGDYGTLLKTTNGGMTFVTKSSSAVPEDYYLSQNYPNPFNPTTKIHYSIERLEHIKLILYDISGKEILTLVNEIQTIGSYEVIFDGSDFSSGIYFYSLYVDNTLIDSKKCLLIK